MVNDKTKEEKGKDKEEDSEGSEEVTDLKFKIRLEKADPDSVKISKKNLCIVSILPESKETEIENHDKMVDYFMA